MEKFGHAVGDQVLKLTAIMIQADLRAYKFLSGALRGRRIFDYFEGKVRRSGGWRYPGAAEGMAKLEWADGAG